jgi:hypothetical protein
MSKPEFTVADLRILFDGKPIAVTLEYALAQDHDARLRAVQKGVDFACNELEQHKHKKGEFGEDALTLEVCSMLKMLGFQAAHDDDVGGHCDIVIKGDESFLWLAEAKKHSDYAWLDKGFQQLATRYSTGVKGQDNGEVLIYCFSKNAAAMLKKWRQELEARNVDVKTTDTACGNPLLFCSTHQHSASGLDFHVRHKAVALYWDPKDT